MPGADTLTCSSLRWGFLHLYLVHSRARVFENATPEPIRDSWMHRRCHPSKEVDQRQ
jgi:hypothetical protein